MRRYRYNRSRRVNEDASMIPASTATTTLLRKTTVGKTDHPLEREADKTADKIMRMPEHPFIQRKGSCSCGEYDDDHVHLKPLAKQVTPFIQSKSGGAVSDGVASKIRSTKGSGSSLNGHAKTYMENRFGADFSDVKIHTGDESVQLSRDLNAKAFTVGKDIYFNKDQYQPETDKGKHLLAHELTHVVQQSSALSSQVVRRQKTPPDAKTSPAHSSTVYHPGVDHGHTPSGKWSYIQDHPNSGFKENRICGHFSPLEVVIAALTVEFRDKPIATKHISWYFKAGGKDFIEDVNIDSMLRTDSGVQSLLFNHIPTTAPSSGKYTGFTKVEQSDYQDQDFRYAFGAIDRFDFEVDYNAGTLHGWFQDRYEWHPVYPGLYTPFPDDEVRETNCVHAAFVELKSTGAADYWMKGEATVPLSVVRAGATAKPGSNL